jgi:hypothetical protein
MSSFPVGFSGPGVTPKRKRAPLSRVLDRRLATYALAAGAAGVSVAASAQAPKENSIVFTPTLLAFVGEKHESLPPIMIDLNGDGITDITIGAAGSGFSSNGSTYSGGFATWGAAAGGGGIEAAQAQGREIGPARNFARGGLLLESQYLLRHQQRNSRCRGPFRAPYHEPLTAYLGVEFQISGETHYGWVRLTTACGEGSGGFGFVVGTVTGYAYNSVAGMPIRAGQISDVGSESDSESPSADAAPATLGALGLGSQGLKIWRPESK